MHLQQDLVRSSYGAFARWGPVQLDLICILEESNTTVTKPVLYAMTVERSSVLLPRL